MPAARGHLHVGSHVRADDEGVLAAHLEVHARHRSAQARHLLAGLHRAGEGDASPTRSSATIASPTSPAPGRASPLPPAGGRSRRQHQGGERRELRGLGHDLRSRPPAPGQLPGQQQQRVVPGHDRSQTPIGSFRTSASCVDSIERDDPAREVAPHLGVVVEGRRRPAHLVGASRPAACRPRGSSGGPALRCSRGCVRHLVKQLGPLDGGSGRPASERLRRAGDGRLELGLRRAAPPASVSSDAGFSTASGVPSPRPARRGSAVWSP